MSFQIGDIREAGCEARFVTDFVGFFGADLVDSEQCREIESRLIPTRS